MLLLTKIEPETWQFNLPATRHIPLKNVGNPAFGVLADQSVSS
jgi:hypothetical protein